MLLPAIITVLEKHGRQEIDPIWLVSNGALLIRIELDLSQTKISDQE